MGVNYIVKDVVNREGLQSRWYCYCLLGIRCSLDFQKGVFLLKKEPFHTEAISLIYFT
jgi:hypothetical protein